MSHSIIYAIFQAMFILFSLLGFFGAFFGLFLVDFISRQQEIRRAQINAQEMINTEKEQKELLQKQAQLKIQEYEIQLSKEDREKIKHIKEQNRKMQSSIDKMSYKKKIEVNSIQDRLNSTDQHLKQAQKKSFQLTDVSDQFNEFNKKYKEQLKKHSDFNWKEYVEQLEERILQEAKQRAYNIAQYVTDSFEKDLERNTQFILECVLNRFVRPGCHERGIQPIRFRNKNTLHMVRGREDSHINAIEKQCGVDIVVDEKNLNLSVQGLDSVRRELGRVVLEKLKNKRRINSSIILNIIRQSKKELFKKINKDGSRICHDLRLFRIPEEVRDMLGALRYRYSFAQNQHFHCEEVGYLCGLLQAEFNASVEDGRRAGLFHDIGKAMDHAQTGGHAVIGADFIQKHGEKDHIVYAVKGHHHDVPPTNDLDFFVIAADAISGSRPGARRSTVDAFEQKILSLEKIGKSFKDVQDLYIMNGGRELRVIVNHKKVSDEEALDISKKIALRIEEECSYPGWIKVTVVRKVETSQQTQVS